MRGARDVVLLLHIRVAVVASLHSKLDSLAGTSSIVKADHALHTNGPAGTMPTSAASTPLRGAPVQEAGRVHDAPAQVHHRTEKVSEGAVQAREYSGHAHDGTRHASQETGMEDEVGSLRDDAIQGVLKRLRSPEMLRSYPAHRISMAISKSFAWIRATSLDGFLLMLALFCVFSNAFKVDCEGCDTAAKANSEPTNRAGATEVGGDTNAQQADLVLQNVQLIQIV